MQGLVLALAIIFLALHPTPTLLAAVAAYGAAWLLVNGLVARAPEWVVRFKLDRRTLPAYALILAVPLTVLFGRRDALFAFEGASAIVANSADRLRLEDTPAVFPAVVFTDHPQTFYVFAPGATATALRVGPGADAVPAVSLGHGVFRVDYDPRLAGEPSAGEGEVTGAIEVDGRSTTRTFTSVRPTPHPRWLRVSVDRELAATVSEETDELIVIDARGLVRRVDVSDGPSDCAFLDERRVVVAHRYDRSLVVIDATSGRVLARVEVPPLAHRLAIAPGGERIALATGGPAPEVLLLDGATLSIDARFPFEGDWLTFAGADTLLVSARRAATVERWRFVGGDDDAGNAPAAREVATLRLGRPAITLAVDEAGARAMIATTDYHPGEAPHYGNHFVQDQLLTVDVGAFRVVDQRLTARRTPDQGSAGNVDRGLSPMGIDLFGSAGARVAFAGSDEVAVLREDAAAPSFLGLRHLPLSAPHGVATFASGAYALTSPADGRIGIFTANDDLRTLIELAPDDAGLLAQSPPALARRMGERTFYEGTRAGIACQSCHSHGDTDHALRNIGERRLAPTLSTRGLAGTAPYLRDGSYARIRDLEHLARTLFRGYARRAPGRAETLEAFVEALPRHPSHGQYGGRDLVRERRGLDAFFRAGCPTCHAPPAFTNLSQHPVATLFPNDAARLGPAAALDTPSLIGVAEAGPYLTDGRARELSEVLREQEPNDLHGHQSSLDDAAALDLAHFLRSL